MGRDGKGGGVKLATLAISAGVAAAVAQRLTELDLRSIGMCWAIGLGMGICVLLLTKREVWHG